MLNAVEVKPGIYWVGGVDWNERNFHGYTTDRGSTYNAYLIVDEHVTLIDTCKRPFADDLLDRISQIVDPAKIEYLVSNHVEMDHSGSIPVVMSRCPNAKLVTSAPKGLAGLQAHYGNDFDYLPVKSGETLNIGKRTLTFVHTPMVHWPDNMVTYCAEEKILFSNDAFGQHFASSMHFDDEVDLCEVMEQAKKYYANIVLPYSRQVQKALETVADLDIDIIAPAHGIIWRSHVPEIIAAYKKWSANETDEYALVVYDSMWHTTEKMAKQIAETFVENGIAVRLLDLKVNHISDIMTEVLSAKYIAVGSPTLNSSMMPTVAAFLCYMKGLSPKNRIGIPFGSYGWAPSGPKEVAEYLEKCGFEMPCGTITHQWTIDEAGLKEVHDKVETMLKDAGEE